MISGRSIPVALVCVGLQLVGCGGKAKHVDEQDTTTDVVDDADLDPSGDVDEDPDADVPEEVPTDVVEEEVWMCETHADCDDDLYCNGRELCDTDGTCLEGDAVRCEDLDPCTENTCDDDIDSCFFIPIDEDGDGYITMLGPGGEVCPGTDCDDTEASVHPDAVEDQCDVVDSDCDGSDAEHIDDDGDGWIDAICDAMTDTGDYSGTGDCDDYWGDIYPGAPEGCDGTTDNDCDGDDTELDTDADLDGFAPPGCGALPENEDCNDDDDTIFPGAVEVCDGIDEDCDSVIDNGFDLDGDGWTTCGGDCDDTLPEINPGMVDLCDDIDNDCSGVADDQLDVAGCTTYYRDLDDDGYGDSGFLLCLCDPDSPGRYDVTNDMDCDDSEALINPDATEICDLGVDNDCDGEFDELAGNCSFANGTGVCTAGVCTLNSCLDGFYDMTGGAADGCESQEDAFEASGGDTCSSRIYRGAVVDSGQTITTTGNIVDVGDVDYYRFFIDDSTDNTHCDTMNLDITITPDAEFRFQVFNDSCGAWSGCSGTRHHFEWNTTTQECGCTTGAGGCSNDDFYIRIMVFRYAGSPDDNEYTLIVSNG